MVHGTLMRSNWQNDASGGSQPGEFLLPSLHYSPCTVAATMKFVSFNINGLRARPTNWPPSSKNISRT
jgi:exodeoxyribonuclease-3